MSQFCALDLTLLATFKALSILDMPHTCLHTLIRSST